MRISTQSALAAGMVLTTITLVGGATLWAAHLEAQARLQRMRVDEIVTGITQMRMATFEYGADGLARAAEQWRFASATVDRLLRGPEFADPEFSPIAEDLRRRRAAARRTFAELHGPPEGGRAVVSEEVEQRFRRQLVNSLLVGQQDSLADAQRLRAISEERSELARRRLMTFSLAGLGLIAVSVVAALLLFRRNVLAPIAELRQATRDIGAGNWVSARTAGGGDEIVDLTRNFNTMVDSLRGMVARLEASREALALANRELESFAYSVSHDLRAPLRSLDGFSAVLLEDYPDRLDAAGRDALERIRAAARHMGQLIDDLLRLSRVSRSELARRSVDLTALAGRLAESLREEFPGRDVACEIQEGMVAHVDPALVEIALRNLLANAWKFTAGVKGATVRIGCRDESGRPCEYFVGDNGVGFDMAHAGQLFSAFQRLHPQSEFPGTGIGLAIVHRVVRRHGGEIRAEALPGRGATFLFTLGEPA